ncbi:MAG: glycoside hydrolase family 38 C-terminal domain-containing protein, partial [Armatimonadota bacterium]
MPVTRRYYTPGFHSDVIWLEDQRDYAVVLLGCMAQNLQGCRADPAFGVFLHELTYLKPYLDSRPTERQFVFDLVREGRVGFGGAHSLPSENLISGEALIRNFAFGRVYHEYLGDKPEIAMLWDVFGHCSQLPQLLAGLRFSGLIWSKEIRGAQPLFWHLGLDGTKLLTRRVMYGQVEIPQEACEATLDSFLPELESLGHEVDLRLGCNDFVPPTPWLIGGSQALAERETLPWTVSGQAHRLYFRDLHRALRAKRLTAPVSARDLEYHHQGTGLTHIDLKIVNRRCENTLVEAEKFSTLALGHGLPYPHLSLDKAWRQVLFGQHHDAITGPCNDRSYLDLIAGYREALELAQAARTRAQGYLTRCVDTADGADADGALVVFNGNNWARADVVEAEVTLPEGSTSFALLASDGSPVPFEVVEATASGVKLRFVASVSGLGTAVYHRCPATGTLPRARRGHGHQIENEFFRLAVNPTHGGLVSLFDKRLDKELLGGDAPGNELVALAEDFTGDPEPPWELHTSGGQVFSRDFPAEIELREGPVSSTLTIRGPFKDCRRVQTVTLYRGVPRVECTTEIAQYNGREDLFAVTFPVALPGVSPVFDDRFGCVVKRRSRGKFDFRTWQWRNYSDCGARRAYQWVDLSSSARLLFMADQQVRSSYALGPMSLVASDASGEAALNVLQEALVKRGVTSTIFRDDCERGRRVGLPSEESTLPLESPNEDLAFGTAFRVIADVADSNELWPPLRATLPADAVGDFDARRQRDGAALLFALDPNVPEGWPPLPTLVLSASDAVVLQRTVEGLAGEITRTGNVSLPAALDLSLAPAQLPEYGFALLNRGTPLHSLEADGTLVLMLMHSVL